MYLHAPDGGRRAIGYLSQYGDILRVSFDEAYIADAGRPTLSLAYRGADEASTRAILASARDTRVSRSDGHWPSYFQNLLPEGHNRERLAQQRGCAADDEFELLAAAGHDLMGALEVEPVPTAEGIPDTVRHWHTALGLDVLEPGFVEMPVEDAAAIPGVVTKFSAVQDGRRYVVRRHGAAGSFILKLPSTRHPDLVDNEFTGYRLCGALGLDCAEASVIGRADADLPEQVRFEQILAVRRFDRTQEGGRIHMEEFAQVLQYEPRQKYGRGLAVDWPAMLRVLDRLSPNPVADVRECVRRIVAFILLGNSDAHLKNWALRYPDGVTPVLAPLYDPVCVAAFFEDVPAGDYGVNRAIDAKLRAFDWPALDALLRSAGLLRPARLMAIARDTVRQAQAEWPALLARDGTPPSVRRCVEARLAGGVALATLAS
ncbi:type II toxin-antitoxin system HipA family toxin [Variovorax sp. ZS18.2.2]|uniref:type II toxin-antitoxin system HipA family toxin n=1 Tax=Variovorax sp. ZS18.2.2 TaxID=2971255 RepID=UPI002151C116|nr:type II toxin-antitoxin system HipA family toxin [Variovorax sp. ZS18.2.2]MCR6479182.1 type II toxin-antitoxin system HipA family toxin [Variovorax sp. ZS18.2.2]